MAVCGLSSMHCVSPIQPDMDSCPSQSVGVTRNLSYWQSGAGARASSCFSSTMVDHNDPDDSGSSQPPTPTRAPSEAKHLVIRDNSLPRHDLELSISSLNDGQRNTKRLKSVKEEFSPHSPNVVKEDLFGGTGGQEEASFSGPPSKRAKSSPSRFRLEENTTGSTRDQPIRHASLSVGSDVTGPGVHGLMQTGSLPASRGNERELSPSGSRGALGGSNKAMMSWWLAPDPKSATMSTEAQHFVSVQDAARTKFSLDGRGIISGAVAQERDFPFKKPSYFPNMLSNMEIEHIRSGENAATAGVTGRPHEQIRSEAPLDPFVDTYQKRNSVSRVSSTSTVSEETGQGPSTPMFSNSREASFQDRGTGFGQILQNPFEVGRRRQPLESHHGLETESQQTGFVRPQQMELRSLQGSPGGNANTNFYDRIRDAAQQPASSTYSQTGFLGAFNPSAGFNLAGQSLPRNTPQIGGGPVHYGSEAPNPAVQQVSSDVLRSLLVSHPSMNSAPSFASQGQTPDPSRLSFPSLSSTDFLVQRQGFSQVTDKYRQPATGPGQAGNHSTSPSHHCFSAELNSSLPPRGSQSGLQNPSGLRDFLSTQGSQAPSSIDPGRGSSVGPHGYSSALELHTNLSLHGPALPPPLTVVMEGRSIGRRIVLQEYDSYESLAAAIRAMFDSHPSAEEPRVHSEGCTLGNAIPGYAIAYEDEEGDVLIAGDLPWRDFVRVAKQIRIVSSTKISFKPPAGPSRS